MTDSPQSSHVRNAGKSVAHSPVPELGAGASPAEPMIRPATPRDLPAVVALWRTLQLASATFEPRLAPNTQSDRWFSEFLAEQLDHENAVVLVAVQGDVVVGYVFGQIMQRPTLVSGDCGYVADLCVRDQSRGQGIGRALYTKIKDWFLARGLRAIEVQIVRANPASQAFWRKMGFGDFLRTLRSEL